MNRSAAVLTGILIFLSGPSLAEPLDARLGLRLQFGAGLPASPGYSLALNPAGLGESPVSLLELDLSSRAALTRIAGVPLVDRGYRSNQDEASAEAVVLGSKPWYTRQWIWWTLGGTAVAASLGGSTVTIEENNGNTTESRGGCTGTSVNTGSTDTGCVGATTDGEGGTVVGTNEEGEPCAVDGFGDDIPDACVPTDGGGFTGRMRLIAYERIDTRWLDAGTGHMGDLIERRGVAAR